MVFAAYCIVLEKLILLILFDATVLYTRLKVQENLKEDSLNTTHLVESIQRMFLCLLSTEKKRFI